MSGSLRACARSLSLVAGLSLSLVGTARAQAASALPRGSADVLIDEGRWMEAEETLYGEARMDPRNPIARARLGRYLAMKGALKPGLVLIEEAQQFGLPASTARALAAPFRSLLDLRRQESAGARDSTFVVRTGAGAGALIRFPFVRSSKRDTVWADLVPRMIGLDSVSGASPRVGIEVVEWLVPAYDVSTRTLRLHANPRAALAARGRRFPVLRDPSGIRVLVAPGRVRPLPDAIAELNAKWWQIDLLHGVLVVR
jgi:hypothetical protein